MSILYDILVRTTINNVRYATSILQIIRLIVVMIVVGFNSAKAKLKILRAHLIEVKLA